MSHVRCVTWPATRHTSSTYIHMGCLQLVGSLKLQVSFAKEPYKTDDILQKRPMILRSLLIVAAPYRYICYANSCTYTYVYMMNESCHTLSVWLGMSHGPHYAHIYTCIHTYMWINTYVNLCYVNNLHESCHTLSLCRHRYTCIHMYTYIYVNKYIYEFMLCE